MTTQTNENNEAKNNIAIEKQEASSFLVKMDLESADLPDLADAEVLPFELTTLYWTPEIKGEEKRVYFDCFKERLMPALEKGQEPETIKCAFFYEKTEDGLATLCNASKRLISALEGNFVQRGTALLITYNGKKKNSTNSFLSDNWSVKPLVPRGQLLAQQSSADVAANGNKAVVSMPPDVQAPVAEPSQIEKGPDGPAF